MKAVGLDSISVNSLALAARMGTTPEERSIPQKIELDIEARFKGKENWRETKLEHTVDWALLKEHAAHLALEKEWVLAEHLASAICERLLERFLLICEVRVRLRKYALPDTASTAVELVRARTEEERC